MATADLEMIEVPRGDRPPVVRARGPLDWVRVNLFSTPFNSAMTILSILFLVWLLPPTINWLFIDAVWTGKDRTACIVPDAGACWPFITAKLGQFVYGRYPLGERWRVDLAFLLFVAGLIAMAVPRIPYKRQAAIYLFGIFPVVAFVLLVGWPAIGLRHVETSLWGGLMLTMVVALVGMATSFPLGIVFALGRRSRLPVLRILSTVFIEVVRGVPLITVLYMASLMLPMFLPAGTSVDQLLRALVGVSLFSAAYMAEVVRGGLQAIPRSQFEGAMALGLSNWQMYRRIVLPQAIRHVIPGIMNSYIALFKDTSLVLIIGLFDLLGIIQLNFTDADWAAPNTAATGYIFAAFVFWSICFSMSRYSLFVERWLKGGRRD